MTEEKKQYKIEGRPSTIFRTVKNKDNPYVMIDRRPIDNPNLSFKAKGILTYLMSRPDGWEVSVADLFNHAKDGEDAIRSGLAELRAAGHMRYVREREKGRITGMLIEVYEMPGSLPHADFPDVEKPDVENPTQVLNVLSSNESISDKTQEPTKLIQKRGDMVDMYIDMMQSPGIKKSIRIDNIESYIQVKLGITPTRRSWKPFLEFIDNQQIKENHSLVTFVDWLTAQPKFDVSFWGPERMRENWDRAFISQSTITRVPGGAFYG